MLVIRAVSFKGRQLGAEVSGRFDEAGGTIGRGDTNTLVLPDPERYISRTHATVSFQAGGFLITDTGTKNPVVLNGRPLGQGSQARLADGDTIKLGDYMLEVTLVARGPAPSPVDARAAGAGAPLIDTGIGRDGAPASQDDPLALFGSGAKASSPFADLLIPSDLPASPPSSQDSPVPGASPWPGIARVRLPDAGAPDDPLADLRGPQPKIDQLFDLRAPEASDLLADVPSVMPGASPEQAGVLDPLEALGAPVRSVSPPSIPDEGAEVLAAFAPPDAKVDPALSLPGEPLPPLASTASPSPAPAPASPTESDPLLHALLKGIGIAGTRAPATLTPESMEIVGRLLREAVQGTLDLLRARGMTKSELRADVTMIAAIDNNPLKFSPTVEAALAHMLAPPVPGFMPPLTAMRDAYDDLRAHQLGFLAGMRAALEDVLGRFAPGTLAERLSKPGLLDSLLSMNRKAKLWDLFVERYDDVAGEAREDFNAAFGKAFLRAYEAQVKQLRGAPRTVRPDGN